MIDAPVVHEKMCDVRYNYKMPYWLVVEDFDGPPYVIFKSKDIVSILEVIDFYRYEHDEDCDYHIVYYLMTE